MTQVSSRYLMPGVETRVKEVFAQLIVEIKTEEEALAFIGSFFSNHERINLPKRFGIFLMLYRGDDYIFIKDELKVSNSTIGSVQKQIVITGFQGMKKTIERVIKDNKPNQKIDLDPVLFRGKRALRNKPIIKPFKKLPY